MELKPSSVGVLSIPRALLIVPYGIETICLNIRDYSYFLLIVPYGIETALNHVQAKCHILF